MAERDKQGRSLKATLTSQEFKRLDALFQAKALVSEMAQGERLLAKFVSDARKNGATWREIGEATGVAGPTAHERWSGRNARSPKAAPVRKPRVPVKREVQQKLAV